LRILRAAAESGHVVGSAVFLACLLFAFFGLTRLVFTIADGRPRPTVKTVRSRFRETAGLLIPPLILLAASLWLGLATPPALPAAWTAAMHALSVTPTP
jgi:hydrogenase-4 component F